MSDVEPGFCVVSMHCKAQETYVVFEQYPCNSSEYTAFVLSHSCPMER